MQDETSVRWRFVGKLPALALLTIASASGYGCGGQAPNGLFTIGGGVIVGSASAGGTQSSSGGTFEAAGTTSANGGSSAAGSPVTSTGGSQAAGGASSGGVAGALPVAGAANGGGASGGAPPDMGGGGGTGGGGTGGAPAPSACDSRLVKPPQLVTDFEQGVAGWYGYIGNAAAPVTSVEPGADMTDHAANFSGGAAKISGMYFPMPCRDVSDFDGISFWGRSEGSQDIRFLAVIPKTDPTMDIGDCNPATMTCSDHPGKPFTFGPQWTLYHAGWSELKQLGFGAKASFSNVINALLWINDGQVQHFSFSIDEVNFYKGAPPTQ